MYAALLRRCAPYAALGLLVLIFYYPLIGAGFMLDDPQHIWLSAANPVHKLLFDPSTYRYISPDNFTPMLGLTFKADAHFFKLNPIGYNIHSLFSLFLAASMFFILLEKYTRRIYAMAASVLFVICPATVSASGWLSTRHYLEGFLFSLLCLYFFPGKSPFRRAISVLCYVVAALYKEVYVVLPLVVFLLITGDIKSRIKRTLPLWAGLGLYLSFRFYMLSGTMGGYVGAVFSPVGLTVNLFRVFIVMLKILFGGWWPLSVLIIIILSLSFLLIDKNPLRLLRYSVAFLVLLLPVATLRDPEGWLGNVIYMRYVFHLSAFILAGAALVAERVDEKRLFRMCMLPLLFISLCALWYIKGSRAVEEHALLRNESMTAVHALIENRDRDFVVSRAPYLSNLNWFLNGVKRAYRLFYGEQIKARVVFPEYLKYNPPALVKEVLSSGDLDQALKERMGKDYEAFLKDYKERPLSGYEYE